MRVYNRVLQSIVEFYFLQAKIVKIIEGCLYYKVIGEDASNIPYL